MSSEARIVVLATDSYFSAEAFRPIAERYRDDIALVVLSQATTQSRSKLWRIVRTASKRYVWYRSTIQLIGATPLGKKNRIETLARELGISVMHSRDINAKGEADRIAAEDPDIGIALNFDQILRAPTLDVFTHGIVNAHAGKLPQDRGISPALWAFARGDHNIWLTVYQMDEGVDTGPIYQQTPIPIVEGETAFSMYRGVSLASGQLLARTVGGVFDEGLVPEAQVGEGSIPHSWPDKSLAQQLRASKRRLISFDDYRTMMQSR